MAGPTENETWLIEEGGRIVQKAAESGIETLTTWEQLVYSLWIADYCMRNAGDLANATDLSRSFPKMGREAAESLSLPVTTELFSDGLDAIEKLYFDRFEAACDETKAASRRAGMA